MYTEVYSGINAFLVGASKLLLAEGVKRKTRGKECYELAEPFFFKLTKPQCRTITITERHWNKTLPYAESLWIASGRNDLSFIRHYLKRMDEFSDDGKFIRGGYGPRFRDYTGSTSDYRVDSINIRNVYAVDQLRYVIECFNKDPFTRRAIVSLGDPVKDDFEQNGNLKETKDIPCTRELHFIKQANSDKLDLIVKMRSNDLIWGASAVNIFNYTYMLEYVAAIIGMNIGNYYHFVDNMHYYEHHRKMIETLSNISEIEEHPTIYQKSFQSLIDFDLLISKLAYEENLMRTDFSSYKYIEMEDNFFQHWYDVLYSFNSSKA